MPTLREETRELIRNSEEGVTVREIVYRIYGATPAAHGDYHSKRNMVNKVLRQMYGDGEIEIEKYGRGGSIYYRMKEE